MVSNFSAAAAQLADVLCPSRQQQVQLYCCCIQAKKRQLRPVKHLVYPYLLEQVVIWRCDELCLTVSAAGAFGDSNPPNVMAAAAEAQDSPSLKFEVYKRVNFCRQGGNVRIWPMEYPVPLFVATHHLPLRPAGTVRSLQSTAYTLIYTYNWQHGERRRLHKRWHSANPSQAKLMVV